MLTLCCVRVVCMLAVRVAQPTTYAGIDNANPQCHPSPSCHAACVRAATVDTAATITCYCYTAGHARLHTCASAAAVCVGTMHVPTDTTARANAQLRCRCFLGALPPSATAVPPAAAAPLVTAATPSAAATAAAPPPPPVSAPPSAAACFAPASTTWRPLRRHGRGTQWGRGDAATSGATGQTPLDPSMSLPKPRRRVSQPHASYLPVLLSW